jgi:hypothetical protein
MKITYKKALKALRSLDQDFIYPGLVCYYQRDGAPACGVGQVLHRDFGFTVQELDDMDYWGNIEAVVQAMYDPEDVLGRATDLRPLGEKYNITLKAQMLLSVFQGEQDTRVTWGEATDEAVKQVKKNYGL